MLDYRILIIIGIIFFSVTIMSMLSKSYYPNYENFNTQNNYSNQSNQPNNQMNFDYGNQPENQMNTNYDNRPDNQTNTNDDNRPNDQINTQQNYQSNNQINSKQIIQEIKNFMSKYKIPSGQICMIQNGRVIHTSSYGNMNCEQNKIYKGPNQPVNDHTVFRIASCSKPITAIGILNLVQNNQLNLNQRMVPILINSGLIDGRQIRDNRIHNITIRHLLRHEGGWDSISTSFDPQYDALKMASSNLLEPAKSHELIRYMMTQPLDFVPGTKSVYSNFGYNILGRIIEIISGQPYEQFIKQNIFSKANIFNAYIGSENPIHRRSNEVMYCDGDVGENAYPIDPKLLQRVPMSYGSDYILRVMDSHGGWVMNALDLAKFGNGMIQNSFISPQLFNEIYQKPDYAPTDKFYSLGLDVEKTPNGITLSHHGALTYGTYSFLAMVPQDQIAVSAIFNHLNPEALKQLMIDIKKILLKKYY